MSARASSTGASPGGARLRWRLIKDAAARLGVGLGGIGVIIAIALIFFYLLTMVMPLFKAPEMARVAAYPLPGISRSDPTVHLLMDEQLEIAARYTASGRVVFFHPGDGKILSEQRLVPPEYGTPVSFAASDEEGRLVAYGLPDGRAMLFKLVFDVSYPNDVRQITPRIEQPLGEAPLDVDPGGRPLLKLAVQGDEEATTVAALVPGGELVLSTFTVEESLMGDEVEVEAEQASLPLADIQPDYLLLDKMQRILYVASREGSLAVVERNGDGELSVLQRLRLLEDGVDLSALEFLTGDISLLVGDSRGRITQWFPVRDEGNRTVLTRIRSFSLGAPVRAIATELRRKEFLAAAADGRVGLYHTTAQRTLLETPIAEGQPIGQAAMAPRANAMLVEDGAGRLHFWHIDNEHPEISWSSLWGKVWYESYPEPAYIWQSSSASNDFEPKISLTPLTFGTIKAAFYAMLFAIPLGIMGAIYTAYFMAPRMRQLVKPSIEIMEALPTVILGFLAGLWLAPLLESNLVGVFAVILLLPPGVLVFAWFWQHLPAGLRQRIPEGWDAALLAPVILLIAALAWLSGPPIEHWLFGGNLPGWLNHELGIDFDQRNSLVVGLAMGFAVIPTIFSLAEDAIFSVPRHLRNGSLALGATQWQTLVRVVLLTASPGIFAAVMIGFGRAVGETMIVLMATGNTPVMDFSIFQGMRTLSANIAVEMPESEVGSTHYRVLFLAALVLFLFTFLFNTVGEIVRQRLRRKYSSL